uniref:methyltransferase n=1 Tax=Staphylococcus aureus TaxID=1280 RepID=UPI00210D6036
IFGQTLHRLTSHGELYVIIQKKPGMQSAKKRMNELFRKEEVINKDKGYYILRRIQA